MILWCLFFWTLNAMHVYVFQCHACTAMDKRGANAVQAHAAGTAMGVGTAIVECWEREGRKDHILYQKNPTKSTELCTTDVKFLVKSLWVRLNTLTLYVKWTYSFRKPEKIPGQLEASFLIFLTLWSITQTHTILTVDADSPIENTVDNDNQCQYLTGEYGWFWLSIWSIVKKTGWYWLTQKKSVDGWYRQAKWT